MVLQVCILMGNNKSAIIIGAGIGGISTAVFLARKGYRVDIFEKNAYPGGRCGQILREGHRFDIGATILLMPGIYREVFSAMGFKFDECFELKELPSVYKVHLSSKQVLSFSRDKEQMKSQLEAIEPGSYSNFRKYISDGYGFFQLSMRDLLGKNFRHLHEFITFRNILLLIRLKVHLKHNTFVKRYFKNPGLQRAFTFQNIYVGQSPLEAPALFAMLPSAELTEGALFPIGGMYGITGFLINKAREMGVNIHYGRAAKKILLSGKAAKGILLSDGSEHLADVIIANPDLPYVYRELLPDRRLSGKIDAKKFACSALVFHWGLKKVYSQLDHHSVFLADDYDRNLELIFKYKSVSDNPSFYVHSPAGTDPSAAPHGEDSVSVIVPMGHLDPKVSHDWNRLINNVRAGVIKRLKNSGLDDIEENIKFEICYPPGAWVTIFNVSRGSVFGSLQHNIMQMGYFRPHSRHKKYRNLYFVGGSTHPGNGVPLVLLSAKHTSERILMEN